MIFWGRARRWVAPDAEKLNPGDLSCPTTGNSEKGNRNEDSLLY